MNWMRIIVSLLLLIVTAQPVLAADTIIRALKPVAARIIMVTTLTATPRSRSVTS
jgi:hypothetical protein